MFKIKYLAIIFKNKIKISLKNMRRGKQWWDDTSYVKLTTKHLLISKTSWRHGQDMSWRHLEDVFSVTICRLPRRLQNAFKTFCKSVFKKSWKTFSRPVQAVMEDKKILCSRCLQDVLETNKMFIWKTNPIHTQDPLIRLR